MGRQTCLNTPSLSQTIPAKPSPPRRPKRPFLSRAFQGRPAYSGQARIKKRSVLVHNTCAAGAYASTHLQDFLFLFSLLGPSYGHAPAWVFSRLLERHKGGVLNDSQGKATTTFYSRGVAEILLMNTHAHKHKHDTTKRYYVVVVVVAVVVNS